MTTLVNDPATDFASGWVDLLPSCRGKEVDQDTIGKVADAAGEIAKTTDTALKLAERFSLFFRGTLDTAGKMIENEVKFIAARRGLRLSDKWERLMDARGLSAPTRPIPPNFALPLLTAAVLEEDDELQDTWTRLLVNAGDAATEMELRSAYVEILRGMSAFDVKNLAVMAGASLSFRGKVDVPILETWNLPKLAIAHNEASGAGEPLSEPVRISINNLNRLGCIASASSTFGGRPVFAFATMTSLGIALYKACS
ncbi:DUF4393 domain-containing protein [Acidicapsa acidisoli]|uniref:DUF4393 domain-containing protein n=1 Tax=Acidicapsa acidisoli TaxID=1615681 RepID=UPI0021DF920A|nr:DUF4393 domain-containing protein [Acidicapsa acidisoli]